MKLILSTLVASLLVCTTPGFAAEGPGKRRPKKVNSKAGRKSQRTLPRARTGARNIIRNPFVQTDDRSERTRFIVKFWDNSQQEIVSHQKVGDSFVLQGVSGVAKYPKRMIVSIVPIKDSAEASNEAGSYADAEISDASGEDSLAKLFEMLR